MLLLFCEKIMVVHSTRWLVGQLRTHSDGVVKAVPANTRLLLSELRQALLTLYGAAVSARCPLFINPVGKSNLISIECVNASAVSQVQSALLFVSQLGGEDGPPVRWDTLHVAGSQRQISAFLASFTPPSR